MVLPSPRLCKVFMPPFLRHARGTVVSYSKGPPMGQIHDEQNAVNWYLIHQPYFPHIPQQPTPINTQDEFRDQTNGGCGNSVWKEELRQRATVQMDSTRHWRFAGTEDMTEVCGGDSN